jgi:hypothetical protein
MAGVGLMGDKIFPSDLPHPQYNPSETRINPAVEVVLGRSDYLQTLGVCKPELNAQAEWERTQAGGQLSGKWHLMKAQRYDDAADTAGMSCTPAASITSVMVFVDGEAHTVTAAQVTEFSVGEACRDISDPYLPSEQRAITASMLRQVGQACVTGNADPMQITGDVVNSGPPRIPDSIVN